MTDKDYWQNQTNAPAHFGSMFKETKSTLGRDILLIGFLIGLAALAGMIYGVWFAPT